MEFIGPLLGVFKHLLWFVPLLLLLGFLKSPFVKGWFGEKLVEQKAARRFPETLYRPFHDLTIRDGEGTTQIDHVYVSPFGIFVLETKNMKGWVFGKASDSQWTQTIYKKKAKFQNPLRQNLKHIKALESLLELPAAVFQSVVVFVGDAELKGQMPPNVCTLSDFDQYVLSFRTEVLSTEQVDAACNMLASARLLRSGETSRAHVAHLREKHKR